MKRGGGKNKGHNFENTVSKILSEWWGVENSFVRTPGSGAWKKISKATNEASKSAVADIVTPNNFPFTIEAKKDESFEFRHLLDNYQDCTLAKWLDKLENEDCLISKKKPMLIFSRNFWSVFAVVKQEDFIKFHVFSIISFVWRNWVIFRLKDFTDTVLKDNLIAEYGKDYA